MSVSNMVLIHGNDPNNLPRIVEVDANGNLGASIVIPVGTTVGLDAGVNNIGDVDVLSIAAGETHTGQVGGTTVRASDSYTRPADTTQYTAGDQVADGTPSVLTFALPRISGGSGVIIYAVCHDSASVAVKPDLRLYLFDTTVTPAADNAAWAPSDAEMLTSIGFVDFSAWEIGTVTAGAAGNCNSYVANLDIPFVATALSIFGVLVVRNAYIPVDSEIFTVKLGALQD